MMTGGTVFAHFIILGKFLQILAHEIDIFLCDIGAEGSKCRLEDF
jgi:hypothetical protein